MGFALYLLPPHSLAVNGRGSVLLFRGGPESRPPWWEVGGEARFAIEMLAVCEGCFSRDFLKMLMPDESEGSMELNLLFSARAAKFLGLKPGQVRKLRDFGEWGAESSHWFSWWRCEDGFGIEESDDRVLMVTNQQSLLSFLITVPPNGVRPFLQRLHTKMMDALESSGAAVPRRVVKVGTTLLTGAARSLTGSMNEQLSLASYYLETGGWESTAKMEALLADRVHLRLPEAFPSAQFDRLCREDPPFRAGRAGGKIVPFPGR